MPSLRERAELALLDLPENLVRDALDDAPWNASSGWEGLAAELERRGLRYTSRGLSFTTTLGREARRVYDER